MTIRDATPADKDLLLELVQEFESELPPLPYADDTPEEDWQRIEKRIREGIVLIAEDGGQPVGFTEAEFAKGHVFVVDLYVRDKARRRGIGPALLAHVADAARTRGLTHMELHVEERNSNAVRFYERLCFRDAAKVMRVGLDELSTERSEAGETIGAIHVQTDHAQAVEQSVSQYLPRIDRAASAAVESGATWTIVRVEPAEPATLRKLGQELSYRFGVTLVLSLERGEVVHFILNDQGRMVDEYLSIPTYYGPLPPGDAVALRANPGVVARLTGANAHAVRSVARNAESLRELPPARELYEQVAAVLGVAP